MNNKSARQMHKQSQHRLKPVYAAVLLAFAVQTAQANPVGGNVVNGQANFSTTGNTLTVTNTPGTIINWQGFSINTNETTRFAQQSASSAVLNRVVGSDPSSILGTLQSNGRVFLINPNGILFGAGAVVDVAGLVASTLNLSDTDFLAGNSHFTAVPGAGNISNAGNITAHGDGQGGGQIFLIAPNVENTGIITAPNGEILLAAGYSVDLVNTNNPNLRVNITAPAGDATNVGKLIASSGSLGLFGTVVRNSGTVSADSATLQGGKIVFKASQRTEVGGTVSATGTTGGTIQVLGNQVGIMDGATVTANGTQGGGTILVGGDYQGKNPGVPNAQVTYVAPTANIHADATGNGNGGKVIVWADDTTRFYGNISARGGIYGGNGGFVETSGHNYLDFQGRVDTLAPRGLVGTLLLDPADITIDNTGPVTLAGGTLGGGLFSGATGNSILTWATINSQLSLGGLTIQTNSAGTGGTGNININAGTTLSSANFLTLLANNNINFATGVAVSGTGGIDLIAGWNNSGIAVTGGAGNIVFAAGSSLSTTGNVILRAGNSVTEALGAFISANTLSISGDVNGGLKFPGGIIMTGPNMVNTLAVDTAIAGGGALTFTNGKALTIGSGTYATGIAAGGNTSAISITTTAGGITVSQGITSAGSVSLTSAGAITEVGAAGLINTTGVLTTSSAGGTTLNGANTVGSFNANNSTSGNISFINNGAFSVGVPGVINTAVGGSIALTDTVTNTMLSNPSGQINTNNGAITLTADKMNLFLSTGTINAGSGNVILQNFTAANAINIGSTTDLALSTLELSQSELNTITTTGLLTIGNTANSGALTVSAATTLNKNTALVNGVGGIAINGAITATGLTLNTTGVGTQTAAAITASGNLTLGGGTFNMTSNITAASVINNAIFNWNGGVLSAPLVNNGTATFSVTGTTYSNAYSGTGALTLAPSGGSFHFAPTLTAGYIFPSVTYNNLGNLFFDTSATITSLTLSGSAFTGAGAITIPSGGVLTSSGTLLQGLAPFTISSGATANLSNTWFLRPVTNAGTMNITGISSINPNPSSSGSNNGSLTNTGVINLNNGWLQPQYGGPFTNNAGGQVIAVSGANKIDATTPFGGPVGIFTNNGAVTVNAGATLGITNGSAATNAGTFTTAAGGALDFSMAALYVPAGTVYTYMGALTNSGTMSFSSGTNTVSGGLANNGVLSVGGGTLNLNGTYTGNAGSSVNLSGGALTIATGVILSTSTLMMTGGILNGAGNVVVTNSFSQSAGSLGNSFGSVSITQSTGNLVIGAVGATGAINLAAPLGTLTVNGAITAASISGLSATGVNLAATGTLTASGAGNAIVLDAGKGNFINGAGAAALTVTLGRWLIYSTDPALNTFGGLLSGNLDLWGKTYATYAPGSVVETGNRYLFALTFSPIPSLTATVNLVPTVVNEIVDISNRIYKIPVDVLAVNTLTTGDGGNTQELPMCN